MPSFVCSGTALACCIAAMEGFQGRWFLGSETGCSSVWSGASQQYDGVSWAAEVTRLAGLPACLSELYSGVLVMYSAAGICRIGFIEAPAVNQGQLQSFCLSFLPAKSTAVFLP